MAWNCAFRSTFRLLPQAGKPFDQLDVFLASDGLSESQVLAKLPYDVARSSNPGALPDRKRYRDGRQLFRSVGLLYEADGLVKVTELGKAVARWRPDLTSSNAAVIARHGAQALAACQLRNPTSDGSGYSPGTLVFPFSFIWRAMLALDGVISSDELNRAIFRTSNEADLVNAIEAIRSARATGDIESMGDEVVTGAAKNDRVLVWMAWASFGWTLITDKRSSGNGTYSIAPKMRRVIEAIAPIRHRHRSFADEASYFEYISDCAGLPEDLR